MQNREHASTISEIARSMAEGIQSYRQEGFFQDLVASGLATGRVFITKGMEDQLLITEPIEVIETLQRTARMEESLEYIAPELTRFGYWFCASPITEALWKILPRSRTKSERELVAGFKKGIARYNREVQEGYREVTIFDVTDAIYPEAQTPTS